MAARPLPVERIAFCHKQFGGAVHSLPKSSVMTDPIVIDTMREGIASEHGIPSAVRPLPEKYIPESRPEMISESSYPVLASTRQERMKSSRINSTLQESSQTQATFHAPSDHERKSANRAINLTLHRCHARCYGLRPHLSRHRFRAGHRRRSPEKCRFAPRV